MTVISLVNTNVFAVDKYTNPAGNKFPIVAWYSFPSEDQITHKRFQDLQDAGFTHIQSDLLGKFQKAIDCIDGTDIKVINSGIVNWNLPVWKDVPCFSMWFIGDEPTYDKFDKFREGKDNFESIDPIKMTYINLLPSYADAVCLHGTFEEYLRTAVRKMKLYFISYDHYPFYQHYDTPEENSNITEAQWVSYMRPTFYNDFEDVKKVCKDNGIPFWAFCMSSAHHGEGAYEYRYIPPKNGELKLEAFTALAYGAQGLQYYRIGAVDGGGNIYTDPPVNINGNTNYIWEYIKNINLRIQKLASIFLDNTVVNVWHTGDVISQGLKPLDAPPYPFTKIEGGSKGFVVSHFIKDSRNYLMIVNKDEKNNQSAKVLRGSQVRRVNDDGVFIRDNHSIFTLAPGDFILFTWS